MKCVFSHDNLVEQQSYYILLKWEFKKQNKTILLWNVLLLQNYLILKNNLKLCHVAVLDISVEYYALW